MLEERLRGRRRVYQGLGPEPADEEEAEAEAREGFEQFWEKKFGSHQADIDDDDLDPDLDEVLPPAPQLEFGLPEDLVVQAVPGVLDPRGGKEEDLGVKDWMEFSRWNVGQQRCVV